jgi:cellobionic acid phosphorylase
MLPYDQERHPVRRSLTAPYGVVNHWKTAPGLEGRGGDCFLSGSISTALRNVYNGLLGIRPMLDALALDPVLPSDWENASVKFSYLGAEVTVTYTSQAGKAGLTVNGEEIASKRKDLALGSEYFTIPDEVFKSGGRYDIRMRVGE